MQRDIEWGVLDPARVGIEHFWGGVDRVYRALRTRPRSPPRFSVADVEDER